MSINRVVISGNLTRDPDLRSTQSGMDVLKFGVAVNDRRKNASTGEWEDYPNFVDCTMFGNRAASLSQYLAKGTKVSIEGKLRWSQWEHEGQKRSKLEVIVDELEFMSSRQNGQGQQQGYGNSPQPAIAPQAAPQPAYGAPQYPQQYVPPTAVASAPVAAMTAAPSLYDDDIPF